MYHYSAHMEEQLSTFERSLTHLVDLCRRLRSDNQRLQDALAASQDEARRLRERCERAGTQLEKLIERMPDHIP